MDTSNAILLAATVLLLAALGLCGCVVYFSFRLLRTVAILKAAPDAKMAAALLRADNGVVVGATEKQPMEMPSTGIEELANSPEAIANLRKKQDPTPDAY